MSVTTRYINRIWSIFVLCLAMVNITSAQISQNLEAEAATLKGTAEIVTCNNASGGQMVKGLDNGAANSLTFQKVNIPKAGDYFISVSYYSVNERSMTYQINDQPAQSTTV